MGNTFGMKHLLKHIVSTFSVFLLSLSLSWGDDFKRALNAYKKGDYTIAFEGFKKLAEQGNAAAQYNVGWMSTQGIGTAQDFSEAVKWYTLSAKQGYSEAQYHLAMKHYNGKGVIQDYKKALKWFLLAAEQGNVLSQYNSGFMFYEGKGTIQDHKEALKWYTLAAEQGYASAQTYLGTMYYAGQGGLIENNVYAHMWFNIGFSNGDENGGKNRDVVAKRMTPSQIKKAQDLARECVKKNYKGC